MLESTRNPVLLPSIQGKWTSGEASCPAGSRKYRLWIPAGYAGVAPSGLVMMLHGCRQRCAEIAEISGMNAVADRNNFLVVYPEQTIKANLLRCWNWFEPNHQWRGAGEPAILAAIAEQVRSKHRVDRDHVYVAGLSAGAAMAVIMAATYPDVFAAVGAVAGLEFRAADGLMAALKAMKHGGGDPHRHASAAAQSMSRGLRKTPRRRLPIIVFQGKADSTVAAVNADQLIEQWALTNHLLSGESHDQPQVMVETTEGSVPGGYRYDKTTYTDPAGHLLMEKWMIEDMGHAWPGSPLRAAYADPGGPNASQEMWRFFSHTSAESLATPGLRSLWQRSVGLLRGATRYVSEFIGSHKPAEKGR